MRLRNVAILSIVFLFVGSLFFMGASAQAEDLALTWSSDITVSKTYTWNFHEVTWKDLSYLGEPIATGSTRQRLRGLLRRLRHRDRDQDQREHQGVL
jgi:hypothetical protein